MPALRTHWPFVMLAIVALVLIFTRLGSDYLGEDEGDTAVLASNILKFGVPKAWDGVAFLDSDQGARLNSHLVMVAHPWVPYYVTAASFFLFGQNTFAARFPFALAAWISIFFVYLFVWRVRANRLTAFCAAALLVFSVQFLLYARQCRYYSLNLLFACWLFWVFFHMKSARQCLLFAALAIVSFHTHPYGLVPVVALGSLTLIHRPFAPQRRWLWFAALPIALFTLPWIALSPSASGVNTDPLRSAGEFLERITQCAIEFTSVTPLIGTLILLLVCLTRAWLEKRKRSGQATSNITAKDVAVIRELGTASNIPPDIPKRAPPPAFETDELSLLLGIFVTLFGYALATAITQSSDSLWLAGIRYASPMLALLAIGAAMLIVKVSRGQLKSAFFLLLIFGLTKLGQITPWMSWNASGFVRVGKYSVAAHIPLKIADRFFGTGLLKFIRDLWCHNSGSVAKTCQFLRENAKPGDVVVVNSAMESVYFHTRLPQAMTILSSYPIYETARQLALPEYVFGIDHARWIVWRSAWEGWAGYSINDVVKQIIDRGGRITTMMEMEDTVFENREDIHFHRFSDGTYLFPFPRPDGLPPSRIGRIDWPNDN